MRRPTRFIIVGILAALAITACAALAFVLMVNLLDDPPHPSDAAMLAQFAQQRPALEELVGMIEQDPAIQRLAPDFTRPDNLAAIGVPPERVADYRHRLLATGIAHGFSHYGDAIEFIVSTRGLAISGSGKSFVHSAEPDPDATVVGGDLDAAVGALTDKDVLLQRRIDGDWWLQLDMR